MARKAYSTSHYETKRCESCRTILIGAFRRNNPSQNLILAHYRVFPNGVVVASLENHSPITRIAAVINAGARDENKNERGVTHALRVYSGLATKNYSKFGLSRTLDQIGAELT